MNPLVPIRPLWQADGMEAIESQIAAHPFVKGMADEHLRLLAADAQPARFSSGQILGEEGTEANRFYLILEGQVAVEARLGSPTDLDVQTVGGGEALGWSWLFPPFQWHFTARTVGPVEAIVWDTARLRDKIAEHPPFGYELARRITGLLVQRLRATHDRLIACCASDSA